MRESVPTARYSPVCNVLRQWKTSLILTYRVYRLYDIDTGGVISLEELSLFASNPYSGDESCIYFSKCIDVYTSLIRLQIHRWSQILL